jgi:uncharacterized membrane protein
LSKLTNGDRPKTDLVVWILLLVYIGALSFLTICKYLSFSYHDFDLAIHAQIVWNILQGSCFNSILGINFLGNHANFISFLLAPFYAIFPSPPTLLFLQSLALGLSAYPIYLIALRYLERKFAAYVVALYLIYPGLVFTNLFEFHPTPFATLFLSWMLYCFLANDYRKFIFWAVLSLLCQENISLTVMMMGIFALIQRKPRKWVWVPLVLGVAYFLFCVKWMIPHFGQGKVDFFTLYSHLGGNLSEALVNLVSHPAYTLKLLTETSRLQYLLLLFSPLCFVPLYGLPAFIPILPIFAQHMLSNRWTDRSMAYHYTAEMLPFIALALIWGMRHFLLRSKKSFLLISLTALCALLAFISGPYKTIDANGISFGQDYSSMVKKMALKEIPDQVPLVATFDFLSHTTNRQHLYSFHHIYEGYHTLSNIPYLLPDFVDYALVDFNDPSIFIRSFCPWNFPMLTKFLLEGWGVEEVWNSTVLFRKNGGHDRYTLFKKLQALPKMQHVLGIEIVPNMLLEGYDKEMQDNGVLKLSLFWRAKGRVDRDISRDFYLSDAEGKSIIKVPIHINYRIHPTIAWKSGELIQEYIYIRTPAAQKMKLPWRLLMTFYDFMTSESIQGKQIIL